DGTGLGLDPYSSRPAKNLSRASASNRANSKDRLSCGRPERNDYGEGRSPGMVGLTIGRGTNFLVSEEKESLEGKTETAACVNGVECALRFHVSSDRKWLALVFVP